jgi:hypothetical protein
MKRSCLFQKENNHENDKIGWNKFRNFVNSIGPDLKKLD